EERGLFRSTDGGKSWEKVLYVSEKAGAVDLSIDPQNPDILYASFWETHRHFWELNSGGPGSGLWKSTDGGDTWADISRAKGLPQAGLLGKIGVSASPAQAGRVWALVESQNDPGLYRSDDFGLNWKLVCDNPELRQRPWYYLHVFADPQDSETVYVANLNFWKSVDGGKSFQEVATAHGDNHALWIDSKNNRRMIEGHDGGAGVSFNGGESFSSIYNQLTAQFYRMDVDDAFPFRVYGTQQDNSSVRVPSDGQDGGIGWRDCQIAGTGESGFIAVDPKDSDIVYVGAVGSSPGGQGSLQRADLRSGQIRLVNVWPEATGGDIAPKDMRYRFPWTFPLIFSPHDPNVLYACGNHVWRSRDDGQNWEQISPDLTRNDPSKQGASGGQITWDTSGAETYCTLACFRESAHEPGVFWASSDDGLVHISRDGGKSWRNVTPAGLPEWIYWQTIEPSPHDPATAYLAGTRYKLDDNTPYLFKTSDYGQSWTVISSGIPADDFTRVIRCDLTTPGLLYAGTETGLYVSQDDGASWQRWEKGLPVVPIYDLRVKGSALVAATHGRSFWVLDDVTPLRAGTGDRGSETGRDSSPQSPVPSLYPPLAAVRVLPDLFADWLPTEGKVYSMASNATYIAGKDEETGQAVRTYLDSGQGAPRGAILHYQLPNPLPDGVTPKLEILNAAGQVIRSFGPKPAGWDKLGDAEKAMEPGPWIPVRAGLNRFVWNLREEGSLRIKGNKTGGEAAKGPYVLPGDYTVRLTVGEGISTQPLQVVKDPRVDVSDEALAEQYDALVAVRSQLNTLYENVVNLRRVQAQVTGWKERLAGNESAVKAADDLLAKLAVVEDALILPGEQKNVYGLLVRPRLNAKLATIVSNINSADGRPTTSSLALVKEYSDAINQQLGELHQILSEDVGEFNELVRGADLPAVG
ncbi:MAG: glycosyl hydrolase, partial [Chloroflexi bacterium]